MGQISQRPDIFHVSLNEFLPCSFCQMAKWMFNGSRETHVGFFCSSLKVRLVTEIRFSSLDAASSNKHVHSHVTDIIRLLFISIYFTAEDTKMTSAMLATNCQSVWSLTNIRTRTIRRYIYLKFLQKLSNAKSGMWYLYNYFTSGLCKDIRSKLGQWYWSSSEDRGKVFKFHFMTKIILLKFQDKNAGTNTRIRN